MNSRKNILFLLLALAISNLTSVEISFGQDSTDISANTPAASGGDGNNLNFHADLFTGRFNYSVPIVAAPGRQGSEPKLSLKYNSSGPNGWCGVGWNLDIGFIQRDGRFGVPVQWGISNALPKYNDTNGFVANLGGSMSRLVRVGATNANPVVYRQQVDTEFLTYNFFTNNHWEVIDKSGTTFFFGEGSTNQMVNTKSNWTSGATSSTWRWVLNRIIDANGNETFFNYTTDGGMIYLTNISYNANTNIPILSATHTVDFILTNRSDTNISFLANYGVTTKLRLSEIHVKVSGANVRKYVLNYNQSPSTTRSLLTSVTQYGSDYTTSLPPFTFNYQVQTPGFGAVTNWPIYSAGQTGTEYNSVAGSTTGSSAYVSVMKMIDIDGDGLPDRVMAMANTPYTGLVVQRNTGSGFAPATTNYLWGPLDRQGEGTINRIGPQGIDDVGQEYLTMTDINGDGYPDRVMLSIGSPYTNWVVQLNSGVEGTNGFLSSINWGPITSEDSDARWRQPYSSPQVNFLDINGDGLPDRVMREFNTPYDRLKVQLNNGNGFGPLVDWLSMDSQGDTTSDLWAMPANTDSQNWIYIMVDINGDGLPDRVMRSYNAPFTNYVVQFNNGSGFEEPLAYWNTVDTQGNPSSDQWGSPIGINSSGEMTTTLIDVNGDGLLDKVSLQYGEYTNWMVQINTGSGFAPAINWGPVNNQSDVDFGFINNDISVPGHVVPFTACDFFDINGDGIPDRVMRPNNAPYTNYLVQLGNGPFPDLLNVVSNGIGGSIQVSYSASTTLDNRNTNWISDPWAEGTKSLLPYNTWVVSQTRSSDGMGNVSTNNYAFKGGYNNAAEKEFRGFSQVTVTDPIGVKTTTYFHQSGGRDNSALGEYLDQSSESKKGIPFRTEVVGNDGLTNKISLSKVQEVVMSTNGWFFPFVSQKITMNFEGLSNYRATAVQYGYDTNTENLIGTTNFGEVTNIMIAGQTFTDIGSDSVYSFLNYATNLGTIVNRPVDSKLTSDGAGTVVLKEALQSYDPKGRMTNAQVWLDSAGSFITTAYNIYDAYGNPIQSTDAAGITTSNVYDSTYKEFSTATITASFTNSTLYDFGSGSPISSTDAKGLVTSNVMDVFYRPIASYISTNAYGTASLWKSRTYYSSGGLSNGVSLNFLHQQANDAVDLTNGYETYVFADGLGRSIEARAEAETGQWRVANTSYDFAGRAYFQTISYFSSGTNFTILTGTNLGTLNNYDHLGRQYMVTPCVQGIFNSLGQLTSTNSTSGDTGSPVGSTLTAFVDGNNPWASVITNALGIVKKSYLDAYGRMIQVAEVTSGGTLNTHYYYDLTGNLTNVVDNSGNAISLTYDSLGRKLGTVHPDMGIWSYSYDNASRMTRQTDARSNSMTFSYSDPLGRLTSKQIYNPTAQLVGTVSYIYDHSDDPNFTVYKGQLYKVIDLQGYERSSYDLRGRVVKNGRLLSINGIEYTTQSTYDDADRVRQLTYPGNAATIQYTYDTGGNISQIASLSGTGTAENFYTPQGFNELGQLISFTNGNGVLTTNAYYANSKRLQLFRSAKGTNTLQSLAYVYDQMANIKSINDQVYTGSASASLTNAVYDSLNRLVSLNSTANGTKSYGYNAIGNILTNQDMGTSAYLYGSKPHAVTNANGTTYVYDACGNMTGRGSQTLTYDAQNQLVAVTGTNVNSAFGYNETGERLWRLGTNGYTIWIGGIYEINNGKILCHVAGTGSLIATFEPQCNAVMNSILGEKTWFAASTGLSAAAAWPFQKGRAYWTFFGTVWAGIMAICLHARRRTGWQRRSLRCRTLRYSCWRQVATYMFIAIFLGANVRNVEATTYTPVFYYYYCNHLGSTNILADRSGNLVQHYEYGTYGQATYTANSSAFPVSNTYTGQIADEETGLYYYGARYYDPQLGRFIQPDDRFDMDDPQSLNPYTYAGNNPLFYVDPTGHDVDGLDLKDAVYMIGTYYDSAGLSSVLNPSVVESQAASTAYANSAASPLNSNNSVDFTHSSFEVHTPPSFSPPSPTSTNFSPPSSSLSQNAADFEFGSNLGAFHFLTDNWHDINTITAPGVGYFENYVVDKIASFGDSNLRSFGKSLGVNPNSDAGKSGAKGSYAGLTVASFLIPLGGEEAAAAKLESVGERVIAETMAGKGGFISKFTMKADEALTAAEKFLGKGYTSSKDGAGVYHSADKLKGFRMDPTSLQGAHYPNVPHVHFEIYRPGQPGKSIVNNHVPYIE